MYGAAATECEGEMIMIEDAGECETAAETLGARFIKVGTYGAIPKGCAAELEDGDVRVWFNDHHTGKANSNRRPICMMPRVVETTEGAESEEGETTVSEEETTMAPEPSIFSFQNEMRLQ